MSLFAALLLLCQFFPSHCSSSTQPLDNIVATHLNMVAASYKLSALNEALCTLLRFATVTTFLIRFSVPFPTSAAKPRKFDFITHILTGKKGKRLGFAQHFFSSSLEGFIREPLFLRHVRPFRNSKFFPTLCFSLFKISKPNL